MRRTVLLALVLVVVLGAAPAGATIPPDTACRRGRVALTFDDGPSRVQTPRLLTILRRHHVQATFFVQGSLVERRPWLVRRMVADGHAVEDHSWDHPDLRRRSSRAVDRQLARTRHAIRRATGRTPAYFRPPYGSTSRRVRAVARRHDLRQVLWTVDSRDWTGRSARRIRLGVLRGLRPHRRNVVLLHDAVRNSPATLRAVPGIVRGIRARGYCLVPLEQVSPLGVVSAAPVAARESSVATLRFTLDGPAQRSGSFRVRTDDPALDRRVRVHRGDRSATVRLLLPGDDRPDPDRHLTVRLDRPSGLRLATTAFDVTVTDDESWAAPVVSLLLSSRRAAASLLP